MNTYELTVILKNQETDALLQKVKDILSRYEAVVSEEENPGIKKLAYEISGEREGFYTYFTLQSDPLAVDKIIKDFRLDRNILRYMFIKIKQKKTA